MFLITQGLKGLTRLLDTIVWPNTGHINNHVFYFCSFFSYPFHTILDISHPLQIIVDGPFPVNSSHWFPLCTVALKLPAIGSLFCFTPNCFFDFKHP